MSFSPDVLRNVCIYPYMRSLRVPVCSRSVSSTRAHVSLAGFASVIVGAAHVGVHGAVCSSAHRMRLCGAAGQASSSPSRSAATQRPSPAEVTWPPHPTRAHLRRVSHSPVFSPLSTFLSTHPLITQTGRSQLLPPWKPGCASGPTSSLISAGLSVCCPHFSCSHLGATLVGLFSQTGLCPLVCARPAPSRLWRLCSNACSLEGPSQPSLHKKALSLSVPTHSSVIPLPKTYP